MNHIQEYYSDLREKARNAQNKGTLRFLAEKSREGLSEFSGPMIKSSFKNQARRENKKTLKVIRKRAKQVD